VFSGPIFSVRQAVWSWFFRRSTAIDDLLDGFWRQCMPLDGL
jgi:hypothetical protein